MAPRLTQLVAEEFVAAMTAPTNRNAAEEFADLLTDLADGSDEYVTAVPAEDEGWLVEDDTTLVVTDDRDGWPAPRRFLVTVQEIRE